MRDTRMLDLRARPQPCHRSRQLRVGHAEVLAVAVLDVDVRQEVGVYSVEVFRMDRQPPFVLLAGPTDDAEA